MYSLAELHMRSHMAVYLRLTDPAAGSADGQSARGWEQQLSDVEIEIIRQLADLRSTLGNSRYEVEISSKFPRNAYVAMLDRMDSLFRAVSLINYCSRAFESYSAEHSPSQWLQHLRRSIKPHGDLELQFTSALVACGTCIARSQALPLFLEVPKTTTIVEAVKSEDGDLLNPTHTHEAGYTMLATLHASNLQAAEDVRDLLRLAEELVGRVDFGQKKL
jgi:hypothetical protein